MTDSFHGRTGQAVLLRKGDAVPENALPMTDSEVLQVQLQRIEDFKPQKEVRSLKYGTYMLSTCTAVSALFINTEIRQGFRLGALKRASTLAPTVVVSGIMAAAVHELLIKHRILVGKEYCPTCTTLRSGTFQVLSSVAYPYVMSILTCLPVARQYYTLNVPPERSGSAFYRLLMKVSPQPAYLVTLALGNMFLGMWMARKELITFDRYLRSPPEGPSEMPIDLQS